MTNWFDGINYDKISLRGIIHQQVFKVLRYKVYHGALGWVVENIKSVKVNLQPMRQQIKIRADDHYFT